MCGIVGFVGKKNAVDPVIAGLKSLEYRGYDSAGVIALGPSRTLYHKEVGSVDRLEKLLTDKQTADLSIAIGHTRWATHGEPSIANAHPHSNSDRTMIVVHNGIIENYQEIKTQLQKNGYKFVTETDTEVIPHLIDWHLKKSKNYEEAFERAVSELKGAYAIASIHTNTPEHLFVARLSSPLVVGVGINEYYLASDATALITKTKKVIYLDDYDVAKISAKKITVKNLQKKSKVSRKEQLLDYDNEVSALGDFPHFMLKEIFDSPSTVVAATRGRVDKKNGSIRLGGLSSVSQQLQYLDRIVIVACGTSYYAGLVGEYLIEELAGIPVEVQLASEFKYRHEPFSRGTAVLAISQSGETADTIAALKKVEEYGVLRLGVVNSPGSTIARITDAGVYCHAGPELSVASTKAFISQVTVLIEIALYLSKDNSKQNKKLISELADLPKKIESILSQTQQIQNISKKYSNFRDFLFIGRGYDYPLALEGALKLKEISYIHAEGYAAGEMKHGPLAMIDEKFPTFAITCGQELAGKTHSNIEEIKARKGPIIALANENDKTIKKLVKDVIYIPKSLPQTQPILAAVAVQLFAYYIAVDKKLNVDRPRNLAKSVTVE